MPGEESSPGATPISTGLAPCSLPLASNTMTVAVFLSMTMYGSVPLSCEAAIQVVTRVAASEVRASSSDDQPATAAGWTGGGAGGRAGVRDAVGAGVPPRVCAREGDGVGAAPARVGDAAGTGVRVGEGVGVALARVGEAAGAGVREADGEGVGIAPVRV